jgi:uncharacterized phage-associated protein
MNTYSSTILAKYIIAYLNDKGVGINMTKAQKLTYIAYGTCWAIKGYRLVDERPRAWPSGPVFPGMREDLLGIDFSSIRLTDDDIKEIAMDNDMRSLVALVYGTFGKCSASALSSWTRRGRSPWQKTMLGDIINDRHIKSYFQSIIITSKKKKSKVNE